MEKVTVLMSTYNGQKFIKEQIDSILNQNDVQVQLNIRDDGSTDRTIAILKEYQNRFDNINVVFGKNIGWKLSFFSLLENTLPEKKMFYAFSDQDDIWLTNKMSNAVELLNDSKPMLYHSNVTIVNSKKEILGNRYGEDFIPNDKNPQAFLDGYGIGATMVFNEKLLSIFNTYKVKNATNHDAYLIALCNLVGKTIYDKNSYILYRRHAENATGFGKSQKVKNPTILMRYRRYRKGPKNNFSIRAQELLVGYGDILPESEKTFLNRIANYRKKKLDKLVLMASLKLKASSLRKTLQIKYRIFNNTL